MASTLFFLALIAASQALTNGTCNSGICNGTSPILTTTVVTAFTTICPTPTVLTYGNQTYTVTSSTTLTITNCPCTLTKPIPSAGIPKVTPSGATGQVCTAKASISPFNSPGPPVILPTTANTVNSPTVGPAILPATTNTVNPTVATTQGTAATASARYTGAGDQLGSNIALMLGVLGLLVL